MIELHSGMWTCQASGWNVSATNSGRLWFTLHIDVA